LKDNNQPDLAESFTQYAFPPRGAEHEMTSLKAHADRMIMEFEEPQPLLIVAVAWKARNEAIDREAGIPVKGISPLLMTLETEMEDPLNWNNLQENINAAIDEVNMDSSPGLPMMQYGSTNADVITKERLLVTRIVKERIERLAMISSMETLDGKPMEAHIQAGFVDPCRVFIKNEPHKMSKIKEGRYRLIWSLSLLDQIIDRVLFSHIAEEEISKFHRMASKGGAGLSTDEQQQDLYQNIILLLGEDFWTDDMKNWDWSYKKWQYEAFWVKCAFKIGFSHQEVKFWFCVLARKTAAYSADLITHVPITLRIMWIRLYFMARVPIVLSDGRILGHGPGGIMKSGLYITLCANSFNRCFLSRLVAKELECKEIGAIAMGDDCGEKLIAANTSSRYIEEEYKKHGFTITDLEHITSPSTTGFEFCSHRLYPDKAVPLNEVKIVLKHLVSKLRHTREQQFQLANDIRHAKNSELFMNFLRPRWEAWIKTDEDNEEISKEDQESRADSCSDSKRSKED